MPSNELYLRKEAALRSLEAWYEEEREKETSRPSHVLRPPINRFGVRSDTNEYHRLYKKEMRAREKKENDDCQKKAD